MGALGDAIRVMNAVEVRDAIAKFADSYDEQVINAGNDNAEIIRSRGGYPSLWERLDNIGSPKGAYATLAELQAAFPTGDTGTYLVVSDGYVYKWNGSAWVSTGWQYQSTGIAKESITLENFSPGLFNDTIIQSGIEASFSNARSYENAYRMKFGYTIPAGLTLNTITAKCKFKTDSSNITQARLKVLVGTNDQIAANITVPSFTPITSGVETELTVTRSNSDTGFTNIVVFVMGWGSNISLPASYLVSNLELYINGNLTEYTAVLDEAYSNVDATCTFNYTGDKLALERHVDSLNTDILNLNESVSNAIKSKVTDNLASFSNGRTFENSYPLKFNCTVTKPYSTIEARVDVTTQSDNLYRGRVKIYFNNSSTDFVNGNYTTMTTGVEKNLSAIATRSSIQTVTVYIFLEGTDKSLPSEYSFKNLKILLDGVEDNTITFTRDATYGSSEITVTIQEGGNYILTDWNNNPIPLATDADIEDLKTKTIDTTVSPLRGKKINALGDSYFAGHTLGPSVTWVSKLAAKYNMTLNNYGINGNLMTGTGGIADRFSTMSNDADYILVDGGRNDYNAGVPIGTNTDNTINTFKGALNVLCQGLIDKYIGKAIIFITCWNVNDAMMAYSDAMLEICGRWGIKCIDASRDSGVYMRSTAFRTQYCITVDDVSHLNDIGHNYALPFFESQISSYRHQ